MSKTVTIPADRNPWSCDINHKHYEYEAGSTQTVPDEVAELISARAAAFPPAPESAKQPWVPSEVSGYAKTADVTAALTPYAKTADVMPKAASVTGYDAEKQQTLTNDTGALKWVDNVSEGE